MKPSLKIKAADGKADKDVRSGQGTKRDRFNPATAFHIELAEIHAWGLGRGGTDERAFHVAGPPVNFVRPTQ